ncbi:MAG: hypothetical protein Crog4KO_29030 [Crocinitomicaceae bacterium]
MITVPTFAMKTPTQFVQKYANTEKGIELATDFAGAIILTPEAKKQIQGKTIQHIELVYTAYKESESFNQKALNNRRVAQLKRLLPQINRDNPAWTFVEQEGAITKEEAEDYFHGFVLHIADPIDFQELRSYLDDYQTKFSTYAIKNAEGGVYVHNSGSRINIPANAVTYADGTPVEGAYELQYREFRDQADIAFSGIPMTYDTGGKTYNFSSAGMFELRAMQGDEELKLSKPATVDFNCTRRADDVAFYEMDDASGEWKKLEAVNFNEPKVAEVEIAQVAQPRAALLMANFGENTQWKCTWSNSSNEVSYSFSENLWTLFNKHREEDPDLQNIVLREDPSITTFWIDSSNREHVQAWINTRQWGEMLVGNVVVNQNSKPIPNDKRATLLAEGSSDPGHTYPNLVKGLNTNDFGVYNCDQIYRIGQARNISPSYVDARTGKPIQQKHVACVIDLSYNGAFSFHPANITCNPEGRNVIVLFTKDKKTYLLPENKFAALDMESDEQLEFKMVEMTDKLQSPDDLRKYLNL